MAAQLILFHFSRDLIRFMHSYYAYPYCFWLTGFFICANHSLKILFHHKLLNIMVSYLLVSLKYVYVAITSTINIYFEHMWNLNTRHIWMIKIYSDYYLKLSPPQLLYFIWWFCYCYKHTMISIVLLIGF